MTGTITTIQRMSLHDGPGIRSVVFLKGCNMRCKWCHNPETWQRRSQLQHIASKCIQCMGCTNVCPNGALTPGEAGPVIDHAICKACGSCADFCPADALTIVGRELSAEKLWDEVAKDLPYFLNSGGGVTVSGGEPLLQEPFVKEFLTICKDHGIGTAIETNASLDWKLFEDLLPVTDLWMCDFKIADSQKHHEWTGIGNENVIANLTKLADNGCKVIVRTPVIPGVNDADEDIEDICKTLSPLAGHISYELLGFHTLGFDKFDNLGMKNELAGKEPLPSKRLEELKTIKDNYNI